MIHCKNCLKVDLEDLIKYLSYIKDTQGTALPLPYEEYCHAEALTSILDNIRKELLDNKTSYLLKEDNPKDDYERGVMNVIRLIEFRIHCICD